MIHPAPLCNFFNWDYFYKFSLYPCIPVTPVSLYPARLELYPCIPVSLYPCIPVSLYPCIPVSQYPCIPVTPVSLYPTRLELYPCIPVSQYPYIPVSLYSCMPGTGYWNPYNPILIPSNFIKLYYRFHHFSGVHFTLSRDNGCI